jgi:hypothetical protein
MTQSLRSGLSQRSYELPEYAQGLPVSKVLTIALLIVHPDQWNILPQYPGSHAFLHSIHCLFTARITIDRRHRNRQAVNVLPERHPVLCKYIVEVDLANVVRALGVGTFAGNYNTYLF